MASMDLEAENERMIEASTMKLKSLSYSLGVSAEALSIGPGSRLLEDCRTAVSLREKAEEELEEVKSFIAGYEEKTAMKNAAEREEKDVRNEMRSLSIRLGAALYEQCSFSLLDKDRFRQIYEDITKEGEAKKGFFSRFTRRSRDDRFLSYAESALRDGAWAGIQGSAEELVAEIQEMQRRDAELVGRITELSGYLNDNKQSFSTSVKQGLADSRRNLANLRAEEEKKFISFGYYLYENGSEWVSEDTPPEILDALQALLTEHDRYNALLDKRKILKKKERVDGVKAMIESEEKKIRILEAEKARIESEIESINEEVARLRIRLDSFSQ